MLIEENRKDNSKSLYECDRCKAKIKGSCKVQRIYLKENGYNTRKLFDFCDNCLTALINGVQKSAKKPVAKSVDFIKKMQEDIEQLKADVRELQKRER